MPESYGGYIIFSNNTSERLDREYFAQSQEKLFNQYIYWGDPCGRKIKIFEWFDKPINRNELEHTVINAAHELKQPFIIQTQ